MYFCTLVVGYSVASLVICAQSSAHWQQVSKLTYPFLIIIIIIIIIIITKAFLIGAVAMVTMVQSAANRRNTHSHTYINAVTTTLSEAYNFGNKKKLHERGRQKLARCGWSPWDKADQTKNR